jgi:hypothetical protein
MLMACGANAAESWGSSTVKWLYPQADGSFVLVLNTNPPGCTAIGLDKYLYVMPSQNGMTVEGAKKVYAAAMMAMATDMTVQVAFDDSTPNCYVNRLLVMK